MVVFKSYDDETLKKLREVHMEIVLEIKRICDKHDIPYIISWGSLLGAVRHEGYIPWDDDFDLEMLRKDYERFIKICESELDPKFYMDYYKYNPKSYYGFLKIRKANTLFDEGGSNGIIERRGIFVDVFPLDNVNDPNNKIDYLIDIMIKNLKEVMYYKNGISKKIRHKAFKVFCIFKPTTLTKIYTKLCTINKNDNSKYCVMHFGHAFKKDVRLKSKLFPTKLYKFEGLMLPGPGDYDYYLKGAYGNDYMKLPPKEKRVNHVPEHLLFDKENVDE